MVAKPLEIVRPRRTLGEEHPDTIVAINNMGALLVNQGKFAEPATYLRDCMKRSRRVLGEEHPDTMRAINNLGALFLIQGKYELAEPLLREALQKCRRAWGDEHPDTLASVEVLVRLLIDHGKPQEGLDLIAPFESAARTTFSDGSKRRSAGFLTMLGIARIAVGFDAERFALAETNLLEAQSIYLTIEDRDPAEPDIRTGVEALVDLYSAWHAAEPRRGYDAKAAEWSAKLSAMEPAKTAPSDDSSDKK